MNDFVLTINEAQARELALALELWCRIGIGDLVHLSGHPAIQKRLVTDQGVTTEDVRRMLTGLKQAVFGLSETDNLNTLSPEVVEGTKRAFDILQVLRRELASTSDTPSLRSVLPVIRISKEPLPQIEQKAPR